MLDWDEQNRQKIDSFTIERRFFYSSFLVRRMIYIHSKKKTVPICLVLRLLFVSYLLNNAYIPIPSFATINVGNFYLYTMLYHCVNKKRWQKYIDDFLLSSSLACICVSFTTAHTRNQGTFFIFIFYFFSAACRMIFPYLSSILRSDSF